MAETLPDKLDFKKLIDWSSAKMRSDESGQEKMDNLSSAKMSSDSSKQIWIRNWSSEPSKSNQNLIKSKTQNATRQIG